MTNVMVISPHADDETLGCGGALLRHRQENCTLAWLLVTEVLEEHGFTLEQVKSRKSEIEQVSKAYGFSKTISLDLPPANLDSLPLGSLITPLSDAIRNFEPEIVYLPFPGDAHSDHSVVFNAAMACVKSFRNPYVRSIRVYETLSETDFGVDPAKRPFQPNLYINISDFLDRKIEIMKLYEGEILPAPFPRSEETIRAQATVRGAVTGTRAAEAFMIIREVQ